MQHELWTLDAVAQAMGGEVHGSPVSAFTGTSIDSRTVRPGDIYFAIKGERLDGHDFVPAAFGSGASLAVVSRIHEAWQGLPLMLVDDPLKAMERLARAARDRSAAQVIAVTGSVGKTSTKEMLLSALSATAQTHASSASFNNHWGVPLSLTRLPQTAGFGVFEIGMNHGGEITPLVGMVRPHVAIITAIAASHIGHFNSLDEIADAKAEIFSGLVSAGHAVINRDSDYYDHLRRSAKAQGVSSIFSFGRHADADVRLEGLALRPDCCCITASVMGEKVMYKLGLPGEHMALNSLAVLAAVKLAGADLARAALALADTKPAKGRGGQIRLVLDGGEVLLLDESYNANPASVSAALALLANMKVGRCGRRIAILGDMLELGDFAPELHRTLLIDIERNSIDTVYLAGPLMKHLWDMLPDAARGAYAQQSAELVDTLLTNIKPGDAVMVKGSNGSRMGLIVDALTAKWPERQREDI